MKDYTQSHCKHQYKKQKMSPKYKSQQLYSWITQNISDSLASCQCFARHFVSFLSAIAKVVTTFNAASLSCIDGIPERDLRIQSAHSQFLPIWTKI